MPLSPRNCTKLDVFLDAAQFKRLLVQRQMADVSRWWIFNGFADHLVALLA